MATTPLSLDIASTALVLIDLQRGIVSTPTVPHAATDVVARAATLAQRCRERGVLVVLVVLVNVDPGPSGVLMPKPMTDVQRPPIAPTPDWAELVPELGRCWPLCSR
ncbi:MAG: isochorismatase family protein [Gemmatimonadota bacterium]|nr:isochorismatase family protein [Gemmatimonadota bacterium]